MKINGGDPSPHNWETAAGLHSHCDLRVRAKQVPLRGPGREEAHTAGQRTRDCGEESDSAVQGTAFGRDVEEKLAQKGKSLLLQPRLRQETVRDPPSPSLLFFFFSIY